MHTKTIGGRTYGLNMLPAAKAWKLRTRLLKLVRGGLGGLIETAGSAVAAGGLDASVDLGALGRGLVATLGDADDEKLWAEVGLLLDGLHCDGAELPRAAWDLHFQGRMSDLDALVAWALEVNYADFFGALRGLASRAVAVRAAKAASGSGTSTGTSLGPA